MGKRKFEKDSVNDKRKKTSSDWLKTAEYLDTKDQDAINYIFVTPKKTEENKILLDAGHYIRSKIDATDLKKLNLPSKITAKNIVNKYRKMARKRPYKVPDIVLEEPSNTEEIDKVDKTETLEDIAPLQPGKSTQLAAKKISEKYKKNQRSKQKKE